MKSWDWHKSQRETNPLRRELPSACTWQIPACSWNPWLPSVMYTKYQWGSSIPCYLVNYLEPLILLPGYIRVFSNISLDSQQCVYFDGHICLCQTVFSLLSIYLAAAAAAKLLQSCLTLCDPIDGSPPGSPIPGILQARILEWVAISFSNAWKWKVKVKSLSCVRLLATPWTVAYQAPPSMGFSRQEYWSGVPLPSPFTWQVSSIK